MVRSGQKKAAECHVRGLNLDDLPPKQLLLPTQHNTDVLVVSLSQHIDKRVNGIGNVGRIL